MAVRNLHWYDSNATRRYPLSDAATALDHKGDLLPNNIIADLNLRYPEHLGDYPFIASVTVTAGIVSITLQVAIDPTDTTTFSPLAVFSMARRQIVAGRHYAMEGQYPGVGGWVVLADGALSDREYTGRLSAGAGLLSPRAARRYRPLPVTSLAKLHNAASLTGIVRLSSEEPVQVVAEEREIDGILRIVVVVRLAQPTAQTDNIVLAQAANVFEKFAGPCGLRPESKNCGQHDPTEAVNTVVPDCNGNIVIEFRGCAAIAQVLEECGIVVDCGLGLNEVCIAKDLPGPGGVLSNEYDDDCFSEASEGISDSPIIFTSENPFPSESNSDIIMGALPYLETFDDGEAQNWTVITGRFAASEEEDSPEQPSESVTPWTPDQITSRPVTGWGDAEELEGNHGDPVASGDWAVHGLLNTTMLMIGSPTLRIASGEKWVHFPVGFNVGYLNYSPLMQVSGLIWAFRHSSDGTIAVCMDRGARGGSMKIFSAGVGGGASPSGLHFFNDSIGAYNGTGNAAFTLAEATPHNFYGKILPNGGSPLMSFDIDNGTPATRTANASMPVSVDGYIFAYNSNEGRSNNTNIRRWCAVDTSGGDITAPEAAALRTWLSAAPPPSPDSGSGSVYSTEAGTSYRNIALWEGFDHSTLQRRYTTEFRLKPGTFNARHNAGILVNRKPLPDFTGRSTYFLIQLDYDTQRFQIMYFNGTSLVPEPAFAELKNVQLAVWYRIVVEVTAGSGNSVNLVATLTAIEGTALTASISELTNKFLPDTGKVGLHTDRADVRFSYFEVEEI